MDVQELVTGLRWELLQQISKQPRTGAELARDLNTTPANVSQHLKLLELGGLVTKERVAGNGKSVSYRLTDRFALVTLLDERASRIVVALDTIQALELRLLLEGKPRSRILRGFLAQYPELAASFTAFGLLHAPGHDGDGKDVQLLVIAPDVKALRKEYANVQIGGKKVVIWSHTPQEFAEGLARGDDYFKSKLAEVEPVLDQQNLFTSWRREHK